MTRTAIRPFEIDKDLDAVKRIWREVGWVDKDNDKYLDDFFAVGDTLVATIDEVPECSVHIIDGTLRLLHTDLPLCVVTAVTTSHIARGHAFAKRLTAAQLRKAAQGGAAVAALGIFDQGFYDQLGFGTGAYDHQLNFDPATLTVPARVPTPERLTLEDYPRMHAALLGRHKVNGSVNLLPERLMRAEFGFSDGGFGLGYSAGERLTHFMWLDTKDERGPYVVRFIAYETTAQLIELLGLLKSLADQVYAVRMMEPPEIQLQSLLERPFRNRVLSSKGRLEAEHRAFAWWQLRVLDIPACVAALHGHGETVRFQLQVTDPVQPLLEADPGWSGVAGDYVVELGVQSSAVAASESGLPVLNCSVNAFTRMLWGVAPASSLAITDEFAGPAALLEDLDRIIHLPAPHTGWDF